MHRMYHAPKARASMQRATPPTLSRVTCAPQSTDNPTQTCSLRAVSADLQPFAFFESMPATEFAPGLTVQNTTAPQKLSDYKLMAFDMDSTLITIECIDEIADVTGKKAEVAAITEATMRGEITDFKDSLRQRVSKLVGVTEADMARVLAERLHLSPGAQKLVQTAQAAGLKVLLVSGGFTYFAEHVRSLLNIDFVRANVLETQNGVLTGGLVEQAWGDICDGAEKRRTLLEVASLLGIASEQCIAVGDGSNDIPMMQAAGLSVAYHAKPRVRAEANICINEGGLDRLLEILQ